MLKKTNQFKDHGGIVTRRNASLQQGNTVLYVSKSIKTLFQNYTVKAFGLTN